MTIIATHTVAVELVLEAPTLAALDLARRRLAARLIETVPFAPVPAGARHSVRVLRATATWPGGKPLEVRPHTPKGGGQ